MPDRKADAFLCCIFAAFCLFALILIHSNLEIKRSKLTMAEKAEMVLKLGLTDICLFTEARYTRHPSMADLHTPFQDHPLSLEHFPSGTLITPPPHLRHHVLDR